MNINGVVQRPLLMQKQGYVWLCIIASMSHPPCTMYHNTEIRIPCDTMKEVIILKMNKNLNYTGLER